MKRDKLIELGNAHKEQFLNELQKSGGIVTVALRNVNISQPRYYTWLKKDLEFKTKVDELIADLKAKNSLTLIPNVNKAQVKRWENSICESVQITPNDVPLLRKRLEMLSVVSTIHDMWGERAKAQDCSNSTLSSYCAIAKVMESALNDLDNVVNGIRETQLKRKSSFIITQPVEKRKIVKL